MLAFFGGICLVLVILFAHIKRFSVSGRRDLYSKWVHCPRPYSQGKGTHQGQKKTATKLALHYFLLFFWFLYYIVFKPFSYFCWTLEGPAYTLVFNFHTFVRTFVRSYVRTYVRTYVSLDQNYLTTHSLNLGSPKFQRIPDLL